MKNIINWIKKNPNRTMFLLPIILVAGISISHVVSWYDIANPINWAIYLSIAIEVGAMTALIAATNKIKGGVWFMFGLITMIQMIGNIFYSFKEIDANGELFKSWVELTGPLWEMVGSDPSDVTAMKRWLAFLQGGLLPIISLTSLHFFVKYDDGKKDKTKEVLEDIVEELKKTDVVEEKKGTIISDWLEEHGDPEIDKIVEERLEEDYNTRLREDAKKVWEKVRELKEEGKLPPDSTPKEIEEEPTALANSQYRNEEVIKEEPIQNTNPEKTLGDDLKKTWRHIVRNNNNISKI
jgi:hypothetical protein